MGRRLRLKRISAGHYQTIDGRWTFKHQSRGGVDHAWPRGWWNIYDREYARYDPEYGDDAWGNRHGTLTDAVDAVARHIPDSVPTNNEGTNK